MTGPIRTLVFCLILVLAALGWGAWERHSGAVAERARATADSLLGVSKTRQDSILRADSLGAAKQQATQDSLRRVLSDSRAHYARSRGTVDSLISATRSDSVVPRDSVAALVGAYQEERAAAQQEIQTLAADTALLERTLAAKDSTIAALSASLNQARGGWAKALQPQSPGLLERAGKIAELVLAVRGGLAFALGK